MSARLSLTSPPPLPDPIVDKIVQNTDPHLGLTIGQAHLNFKTFGPNELSRKKSGDAFTILLRQFQSTVVMLLLAAAFASWVTHEIMQAVAIIIAVAINAVVGFATELKAKFSLDSLEALAGPVARVIRSGREMELPASDIVPGDLIILDAGARVPADAILIETAALSIEESMLSGESTPVYKDARTDSSDKTNVVYQGSLVLSGRARAIVSATGNQTKLGKLGQLLSETVQTRTPLEEQLEKLGQQLTWLTIILCGLLLLVSLVCHGQLWTMLQTSIALAVAAIPEGMPVVATLALAAGTRRMVKSGALIRQLAAVETLGCTTVVCCDKTGTLTENQMRVTDLVLPGRHLKVSGQGYNPIGSVTENGADVCLQTDKTLVDFLRIASLCNDARLESHKEDPEWHVHGDSTEGAILTAAYKVGLDPHQLRCTYPRVFELPFDLTRKRMTTVHEFPDGKTFVCTKGSPGTILKLCAFLATADVAKVFEEKDRNWFIEQNEELAKQGLRVIAVALSPLNDPTIAYEAETLEHNMIFLGLIGMADRPRAEVEGAIKSCHQAGIRVVMLTGDQPLTAAAIARDLNILDNESSAGVLTGAELETMSDSQLGKTLKTAQVLARVNPETKLKVVKTLQTANEIVAMTGDGVNDAPALRQADIGVCMGRSGTALAREASNMVITDDNFASIVKAIEQGRIIYTNIRQAIAYLLTASLSAVLAVFAMVLTGVSTPFSPLLLLWLNLIMHIFPGLGIVLQRGGAGVMRRAPRKSKEHLLSFEIQLGIIYRSMIIAGITVASIYASRYFQLTDPKTIGFATLSLSLLLQAFSWAMRRKRYSLLHLKAVCNFPMLGSMAMSFLLLYAAISLKPLQLVLGTSALGFHEICFVILAALYSFALTEVIHRTHT